MADHSKPSPRNSDLLVVAAILVFALFMFHIGLAIKGRAIMREQHLSTALEYAKHGIDLWNPIVPGANANDAPTILEFPIWQALVAVLMKVFGLWYGWGNVVSLLFHLSTLWPVFDFGRRFWSSREGWWGVVVFLAQPLTFIYGGMASSDSAAASLNVWFLYLALLTVQGGGWRLFPFAAIVGCLAATLKAPFFMSAGLTLFFVVIWRHRARFSAWVQLILLGVIPLAALTIWNRHGAHCYELSEFSRFDPRITSTQSPAFLWWFGDLPSHFSVRNWARGAWRAGIGCLGTFTLVVLPLVGWSIRDTKWPRLWLLGCLGTTLVFTHVVLIHWHYYFMLQVPIALLCARALTAIEPSIWELTAWSGTKRALIVTIVLGGSLVQGMEVAHWKALANRYTSECAALVAKLTTSSDKLLVWRPEWGVLLMQADRRGLCLGGSEILANERALARLKELGYTYLIMLNPSPMDAAVTTLSGSGLNERVDLQAQLPENARQWPVVLKNDSLLIAEIPR